MWYQPFSLEVLESKEPKIESILKTDFYLVYEGLFGKAVYDQVEFVLNRAVFVAPAEHLYGGRRYAMELKL
jgi:hypothetical protein